MTGDGTNDAPALAQADVGADDYVTKSFSAAELLARVRAALRRNAQSFEQTSHMQLGALRMDLNRRAASGPGGDIHLTQIEYRVLECLARSAGLIVTQQQIIREVWGPYREHDTRNLRVAVKSLRQKLERDPRRPCYIITESGVGYRLRIDSPDNEVGQA